MGSLPAETKIPYIKTPCIHSPELSRVAGWYLRPSRYLHADLRN